MALANQPSWHPTRKLVGMMVSGAIMGMAQTLLRHYWPDHPFAPFMQDIDLWLQGAVMIAVGYFTRNKSDGPVEQPSALQELGDSDSGQLSFSPLWTEAEEAGEAGIGKQTPKAKGEED